MPIAHKYLPSPLMGEGAGGGGTRASSPHPSLPPPGGEGYDVGGCQDYLTDVLVMGAAFGRGEGSFTPRCEPARGQEPCG
jgi:hypothetical protein